MAIAPDPHAVPDDEPFPAPPPLTPLMKVACDVDALHALGPCAAGERRFVPLRGGRVWGPALCGRIVDGGVDWQWLRDDGVLEIDAHYAIRLDADGALVEVRSQGLRHGPPEVMAALARGEDVPHDAYFFRTLVRLTTGAPAWRHLNRVMAIASGRREARRVRLDLWQLG